MKYFLSLLAIVALAGAGCAQVSTELESETVVDVEAAESVEVDVEAEAAAEAGAQGGVEIEVETVPVTEVILGQEADVQVSMEVANFSFTPNVIVASPGDRVSVTFAKSSGIHTFSIDEIGLDFAIAEGEKLNFTAPSEPGQYPFYCSIGSHRAMGLLGTLVVE